MHTLQQDQVHEYGKLPENLLADPGYAIWQRGNGPFVSTGTPLFTADEWEADAGAGENTTVVRDTVNQLYGNSCLDVSYTKVSADGKVRQAVENYKDLEGLWLTFSVDIKCDVASAARVAILDYTGTSQWDWSAYHTGGGGWERLTAVKQVRTGLVSNSGFPHDFGLWVGLQFSASVSNCLMDGASLVRGKYPKGIPYVPLTPEEDIGKCQRFYETGEMIFEGLGGVVTSGPPFPPAPLETASYIFAAEKQAVPNMTLVPGGLINCTPPVPIADRSGYSATLSIVALDPALGPSPIGNYSAGWVWIAEVG